MYVYSLTFMCNLLTPTHIQHLLTQWQHSKWIRRLMMSTHTQPKQQQLPRKQATVLQNDRQTVYLLLQLPPHFTIDRLCNLIRESTAIKKRIYGICVCVCTTTPTSSIIMWASAGTNKQQCCRSLLLVISKRDR